RRSSKYRAVRLWQNGERLSPERRGTLALHIRLGEADVGKQVVVRFGKMEALTSAVLKPEDQSQRSGRQVAEGAGANKRAVFSASGGILHSLAPSGGGIAVAVQE